MNGIKECEEILTFHPGSYVKEIVDDLNITQEEFSMRLGTSLKVISEIINEEAPINIETASKLYNLTGISAQTWLNLQN